MNAGKEAEDVGQVEPLAAQGAAAADEVLFSAEQLGAGAAGAAEDASDAMTAAQRAAQRAVGDVASDAADAAAAAQRAAQRAAADVASDATDAMTATQRAAERMLSDVQQQATQAAASAVQGAAEAAAAAAAEAAGAASAVASAAGSAAAPARSPQGQLSAPAGPAGSLQAPEPPAGSLSAPKPPAGALEAPQPPAGSLAAPEQPVASLPPPAEPGSQATTSSSGASTNGSSGPSGEGSSGARVGRGSGAADRIEEIAAVKQQLVSMLASLDRGAAATEDQAQRVDNLARRLELLGGAVSLGWDKPAGGGKPGMALLDGRWRLLYSSGFTSGSLGGRRPGPSFGSLPLTLGPVYQDIYTDKSELDNVVELFLRFSLASLPGVSAGVPSANARLRHSYQIIGANTIEITFEDTEVKLAGGLQGWLDNLPTFAVPKLPEFLQTPKGVRSARFDVVFLDETMRITRGDRDELRVFLKGAV
ncbi:hypothetical protein COHA_006845 [Chlorella ohadii]|uniref:Plastid lipid-associated protein/fibrillin conserved domain-containing protein n=1 Tax=Chlorella ohadii TaxID=2649997 RepID=A0AAD5DS32_9CHLO|nr:hypothetical protein COHA_006845 [Chlorella ohadii]